MSDLYVQGRFPGQATELSSICFDTVLRHLKPSEIYLTVSDAGAPASNVDLRKQEISCHNPVSLLAQGSQGALQQVVLI